jgi:hypothetical protein
MPNFPELLYLISWVALSLPLTYLTLSSRRQVQELPIQTIQHNIDKLGDLEFVESLTYMDNGRIAVENSESPFIVSTASCLSGCNR